MSGPIFISYRREESRWSAGRLYDRLTRHFDRKQVFMDIDGIALGVDFVKMIEKKVSECDVLIAVIGERWLTAKDGQGGRRLDNPEDFVRMEIAAALKRDIRVIPVLMDGVSMPASRDLPDDLKALARRNALAVSDTGFEDDCGRLVAAIKQAQTERSKIAPGRNQARAKRLLAVALAVVLLAGIGVFRFAVHQQQTVNLLTPAPTATPALTPTPTTEAAAQAAFSYGLAAFDTKEYDKAIVDYTEAIRLKPNNAKAYKERGRAYSAKKQYDNALSDYNEAIRLDPNFAAAYNNRGYVYYEKKDYDKAISDYNQSIRLDPNYATVYLNRGVAHYDKKDYDKAISDYDEAIRLDPNYSYAYNNRGNAYHAKKDYDKAISDYNESIRLDPNYARAYRNRGNAYKSKGELDQAKADFAKADELTRPGQPPAESKLANPSSINAQRAGVDGPDQSGRSERPSE
jgi:tetratricopeptide (TPR) repeat protein